jgi:hypothetical protein
MSLTIVCRVLQFSKRFHDACHKEEAKRKRIAGRDNYRSSYSVGVLVSLAKRLMEAQFTVRPGGSR